MINRILYWFVTLPSLAKAGCLGTAVLIAACTLTIVASIPAARERQAARATQVALNSTATSVAQIAATGVAEQRATSTTLALAVAATQTSTAQFAIAAQTAVAGSTATAQAIAAATSSAVAAAATSQANANATATAAAVPTPIPIVAATIAYEELGRYEHVGRTWVVILIAPDMDRETLVRLAQQLREQDVRSSFHIFDDGSKVQQFIDASLNYGKVRDKDGVAKFPEDCADASYCNNLIKQGKSAYPYPEEWVSQHYIAMINEITIARGKTQWQLIIQQDDTTIDIDVATTAWGGQRQDGVVTEQEVAGWVQEYLSIAKTFACCVQRVEVVDRQQMVVVITLDGELVSRPAEARQSVASGVFTSYASSLGECLRIVRFIDAAGNPLPDAYTNTLCR